MAQTERKELPKSIEAERAVLGAMILDKGALMDVSDYIKKDDFFLEAHKEIFDAIMQLNQVNYSAINDRASCFSAASYQRKRIFSGRGRGLRRRHRFGRFPTYHNLWKAILSYTDEYLHFLCLLQHLCPCHVLCRTQDMSISVQTSP